MEPPTRPTSSKRPTTGQGSGQMASQKFVSEGSPNPFISNPKSIHANTDNRRPRSRNQTVSIGWEEDTESTRRRTSRLQIELAECVETKTVTTTTTTKRSYPPLLIRQKSLELLDPKEYPLAIKPAPAELTKISYDADVEEDCTFADGLSRIHRRASETNTLHHTHKRPVRQESQESQESLLSQRSQMSEAAEAQDAPTAQAVRQKLMLSTLGGSTKWGSSARRSSNMRSKSPKSNNRVRKTSRTLDNQYRHSHSNAPNITKNLPRGLGSSSSHDTTSPETPDASEFEPSMLDTSNTSLQPDTYTPLSVLSHGESFECNADSSEVQEPFANAVATPPIAESDLEPAENSDSLFSNPVAQRPILNTSIAQNASLPSPGLSPTFASAEFPGGFADGLPVEDGIASPDTQSGDSQDTLEDEGIKESNQIMDLPHLRRPSILTAQSMFESFDAMPNNMKTLMMYQLLRRCTKKTLHVLADVIGPALKCDFLEQLPVELSLHILGLLDHRDLCRAARVSKHWRNVIDTNETGWKELFDRAGFTLPLGELERAIYQGWGWQDPYGPNSGEEDLRVRANISSDGDLTFLSSTKIEEPARKVRPSTKRKRLGVGLGADRSKRRATGSYGSGKNFHFGFHKSEGPLSAATAAAVAVPDPQLGLPSLRKLHLFKSLYRRHFLLKNSWMNPEVAPHHFAFPAHPSHVITCLQFDDDKILTGSDDALIHVYDTKTGALRKKLEGHEGGVWALQYEGNVLVSGSTDRSVRVWDIEKGLCTQVFHGHTSTVRCLQILMPEYSGKSEKGRPVMLPEKPLIITGSRDSQLRVWRLPEQGSKRYIQTSTPANDADCPYFVRVLIGHSHSVRAIAAHQDTLVSGSYDNTVRVWKISTGETLHRLTGHAMKVYSVVLDHKRNRCISGSMDNFVKIWSLETGECLYTLEGHSSLVGLLDLADERLVSAAADSTLRIWDPENGHCKSTLTAHTGAITCFQHDGQKVISGSDRTLKMWNVKTGECMKDLLTDLSGVWQVKFDERRCVAAVQREHLTFLEVLDFGASRDGIPAFQRGVRNVLRSGEARPVVEEIVDDA
ncbi:WD40-repeat-containing domain protein [Amylocarpus encephaloides]|uniref:WD40-repeat-containing domain protein n=1 Tax=Amylocarpus encephaloides TaxID=45428 RepID=A0A9P8CBB9_9HELO|nr:WD40-repeat-containing domain protein [Amylocarpus encephaloides]